MTKQLRAGVLGCCLLTATAAAAADEPTVALRYRFEPGLVLRYREVTSGSHEARRADYVDEGTTYAESDKSAAVVAVDDNGVATLRLRVDRAVLRPTRTDGDLPFLDTDSDAEVPFEYRAIAEAVGKPLAEIRVDGSGDYIDGKPLLLESTLAAISKGETGGDAVTRNFLIPLPTEAVAVGHRWEQRFTGTISVGDRGLNKTVKYRRKFRLDAIDGDRATISVRTSLLTPLADPKTLAQVVTREPRGEIVFDVARGVLVSHRSWASGTAFGFAGPNSRFRADSEQTMTLAEVAVADGESVAARGE